MTVFYSLHRVQRMSTLSRSNPFSSFDPARSRSADTAIRLIVNADDLGRGAIRDRGIFRAFQDGIVTSGSLLANGPSFADAVREATALGLPLGVHLNLAEGRSLSGEIHGLTTNGEFPGKVETRRRLAGGNVDRQALRTEIAAQISRIFDAGLRPDHFDTHQHTILFPNVAQAILEVVCQFGITAARLPQPQETPTADPDGSLGEELALYRSLAPNLGRTLRARRIATPDGLWGMPCLNRLDESALAATLNALAPGNWELMVHPGGYDPADPFATPERETEVTALTSPAILELVRQRQIQLIHFGELACAS